jgi:hypothetical protein
MIKILSEIEKPPAALAGGGLGAAMQQPSFDQASFPARALEPLIRRAGMSRQQPGLERKICMTFSQVEQSSKRRVKRNAGRPACKRKPIALC